MSEVISFNPMPGNNRTILHVVPAFGHGGMEKVLCAVVNATANQYTHEILSLDKNAQAKQWLQAGNVRVSTFEKPTSNRAFFTRLLEILRQRQPDILMTYNWGATDAIWLGRLAGIKHIIHSEHGFNMEEARIPNLKRDLIRFLVYRLTTKVVVVSHELLTLMRRRFFLGNGRVAYIPNGIDTDFYSPDETERNKMRTRLGFTNTDFIVGFTGRLDPVKNLALMLDIVEACVEKDKDFKLLIVGDGPERGLLEALMCLKHLQKRVTMVGQQHDVLPYLRAMDVFLLTSVREQMPLSVLEAMSVGLPVVATAVGELPSIVDEGKNGFVRDLEADAGAFATILCTLKLSGGYESIRQEARNTVLSRFREDAMLQNYKSLLREVG